MDLDESVDDPANAADGVGGADPDGGSGEVELGLSSEADAAEPTGLPADDSTAEAIGVENEWPTEGAEQQALHVEQES